jgi:DNA mismatch endonuclease, patch repair protein
MAKAQSPLVTDPVRSALMGRVRQNGTTPELAVAGALRDLGLSYRKNVRSLPGAPDFANRRRRWAVFVNGCYWHHHSCGRGTTPVRNREFWAAKFVANRLRDATAIRSLRRQGFRVVVIWECQSRDPVTMRKRLSAIPGARQVSSGSQTA